MSIKALIEEIANNRWLIFALRVALGGIFIAASVTKIPHQAEFINIVTSYGILPDSLARFYALIVPWAELLIGCSLVLGIFPRLAAALSIPLIVSFIAASAYGLFQPVGDACGCFGQSIPISHSVSLAIDAVMLLMAVPLLLHKHEAEFLSIGPLLSRLNLSLGRRRFIFEKGSKFAVVALAVLVIGMPLLARAQSSSDTNPDNSIDSMIDDALDSGKPAFLVFYECYICEVRAIASLEEQYYDENDTYGDLIAFIYISSEEDPQAVEQFDVENFPTMLLITDKVGEEYEVHQRFVGPVNSDMLQNIKESFDQVLGNGADNGDDNGADNGGAQSDVDLMIDDALDSGKPACVLFYWGCRCAIRDELQIIDNLELEYGEWIAFICHDVNDEDYPEAVKEKFNVTESPTILLITGKVGEEYEVHQRFVGPVNSDMLQNIKESFDQVLAEFAGSD
jgi:putative oxidoreductase